MANPWQQQNLIITAATIPVALFVCWWFFKKSTSGESSKNSDTQSITSRESLDCGLTVERPKENGKLISSNILEDLQVPNYEAQFDEDLNFTGGLLDAVSDDDEGEIERMLASNRVLLDEINIDLVEDKIELQQDDKKIQEEIKTKDLMETCNIFDDTNKDEQCENELDLGTHQSLSQNNGYAENESIDQLTANTEIKKELDENCEMDENFENQCNSKTNEVNTSGSGVAATADLFKLGDIDQSLLEAIHINLERIDCENAFIYENSGSREIISNNIDLCKSNESDELKNTNNNNVLSRNGQTQNSGDFQEHLKKNGSTVEENDGYFAENGIRNSNDVEAGISDDCLSSNSEGLDTNSHSKHFNGDHLGKDKDLDWCVDADFEVFVEFPSELVGLLIGKQGRNIKQLKQDSGADVFVHEAPLRDDIQVLQICGVQSEVESCVARIKRRFNNVNLSSFDSSTLELSNHRSGNSPVPMYPVANISRLQLPEGMTCNVSVSAIASVDCVFVQQYLHPSFQALANLECAMRVCYAEPSTPSLISPIQVGLICAAQQHGTWYRAEIVQYFEESHEIMIKFMDYGGYATVYESSIKQIRADFVTLPFQATECYLDNIVYDKDNECHEENVVKLQELLKEGSFQCRITGYRSDGNPKIHLFKCFMGKVTLINELMAKNGLATWVEPSPPLLKC